AGQCPRGQRSPSLRPATQRGAVSCKRAAERDGAEDEPVRRGEPGAGRDRTPDIGLRAAADRYPRHLWPPYPGRADAEPRAAADWPRLAAEGTGSDVDRRRGRAGIAQWYSVGSGGAADHLRHGAASAPGLRGLPDPCARDGHAGQVVPGAPLSRSPGSAPTSPVRVWLTAATAW